MAASRVTSSFWLAMCCFGGADAALTSPNSLLQLGSSSTRKGATALSGATSLSSTLAGFQKFTDQLLAQRLAGSTIDDDTRKLVTFIVDIIDDTFYDELQGMHKIDIQAMLACAPCGSETDFDNAAVDWNGSPLFNSSEYASANFCSHQLGTDIDSNPVTGTPNNHPAGTAYSSWTWTSFDNDGNDEAAILALRGDLKTCISDKQAAQKTVDEKCSEYESYRVAGYDDHTNADTSVLEYPPCAQAGAVSSLIAVDGKLFTASEKTYGSVSDRMIQAEDEDTVADMETCLGNMKNWLDPLYNKYILCKNKDIDLGNCISQHHAYEQSVCQWRQNQHALCRLYQKRIEDPDDGACPESSCADVSMKVDARKADYEAGQRIICLLEGIIQSGTNATTERSNTSSSEAAFGTLLANCRQQTTWDAWGDGTATFSTSGTATHAGNVNYFNYQTAKTNKGSVCALSRKYSHTAQQAVTATTNYYNATCEIDLTYWTIPIQCSTVKPASYNSSYCIVDTVFPAMPCSADFFTDSRFGYASYNDFGPGEVFKDTNGKFWDSSSKTWMEGSAPDIAERTFPDYNSGFFDYFTYGNCVQCAAPSDAAVGWNSANCEGTTPGGNFATKGEGMLSSATTTTNQFQCNTFYQAHPEGPRGQTSAWSTNPISTEYCDRMFVAKAC